MAKQATEIVEKKVPNRSAMLFVDVPAKFILELASGMRDPDDLAADYGFTPKQWKELQKYEPFVKALDAKKSELKLAGFTFRLKAQVLAEELLDKLGIQAHKEDASFHTTLECAKFAAKAAGIDAPVREDDGNGGNTININIDLGAGNSIHIERKIPAAVRKEIEAEEAQIIEGEVVEDVIPYDAKRLFEVSL